MRNNLEVSRRDRMPVLNMLDVDDLFERAFRDPFSLFNELRPNVAREEQWMRPNFDVEETDQAYLLSVDIPGVRKEDININLSEDVLTVSGERKYESRNKGGERYEKSYGRFMRSFTLPSTVEAGNVEASLEDGVLRIALPKSEKAKPRNIEIGSGKGGFFSRLIGASEKKDEGAQESKKSGAAH